MIFYIFLFKRQIGGPGHSAPEAEVREPPCAHLYSDDEDDGHPGGLLRPQAAHLCAGR